MPFRVRPAPLSDTDKAAAGNELYNEEKVEIDEVASALSTRTTSEAAGDIAGYSAGFGASVLKTLTYPFPKGRTYQMRTG